MREARDWAMTDFNEVEYNAQLELSESPRDSKRDDLVYYLAVQPRHP
jgi:hypothetical protein